MTSPVPNPDWNLELYEWQDNNVEVIPKHMENRQLGVMLESSGDIWRELTSNPQPASGYIMEKVNRIERYLASPIDREDIFASLSEEDEERTDKLMERWFSVKGLSPRLTAVRNLNIAFADQNQDGVRYNLRKFKEEWRSSQQQSHAPPGVGHHRREVRVREYPRRSH